MLVAQHAGCFGNSDATSACLQTLIEGAATLSAMCCAGSDVLPSNQELIGHRIGVLWPEHASYFLGHVTAYSHEARLLVTFISTLRIYH